MRIVSSSGIRADVPDELGEKLLADGWTTERPAPKRASRTTKKTAATPADVDE